jgi:hypothetical protein
VCLRVTGHYYQQITVREKKVASTRTFSERECKLQYLTQKPVFAELVCPYMPTTNQTNAECSNIMLKIAEYITIFIVLIITIKCIISNFNKSYSFLTGK